MKKTVIKGQAVCKVCGRMFTTRDGVLADHGHRQNGPGNSHFCFGSRMCADSSYEEFAQVIDRRADLYAKWIDEAIQNGQEVSEFYKHRVQEFRRLAQELRAKATK